nr:MAG TPA: hypothetical protein [Caudoviricetes sp.]
MSNCYKYTIYSVKIRDIYYIWYIFYVRKKRTFLMEFWR